MFLFINYNSGVPFIMLITMMDEATESRASIVDWLTHNIPNINKNLIFCVTNYDDRYLSCNTIIDIN